MITIKLNESTRKRAVTKGHRSLLPNFGKPWDNTGTSDAVKKEIIKFFPEVEIIHNPIKQTNSVYRVLHRASANPSAEDLLVHEFVIKYPVGMWLVESMLFHDAHRKYQSGDKAKEYIKEEKEFQAKKDKEHDRQLSDLSEGYAKDLAFALKGRQSIIVPNNYQITTLPGGSNVTNSRESQGLLL